MNLLIEEFIMSENEIVESPALDEVEFEEIDLDLSKIIAGDSDLPTKMFPYFSENNDCEFEIKAMSAIDRDRFNQWKEKEALSSLTGMGGGNTNVYKLFADLLRRYFIGWKRVSLWDLTNFLTMRVGDYSSEEMKTKFVKFSPKNRDQILQADRGFCLWILNTASDRKSFQMEEDIDRLKK